MNIKEIRDIISQKFVKYDEPWKQIFRAYSFHADIPYALWFFDYSENINLKTFNIRDYQEQFLRNEFYRVAGSLQWNLYYYFLCDEGAFRKLDQCGIIRNVEADRLYARKYVRTPQMLRTDLTSLASVSTTKPSDMPIDVGSLWQKILIDKGLSVVFSSLPYAETMRQIEAGTKDEIQGKDHAGIAYQNEKKIHFVEKLYLKNYRPRPKVKDYSFGTCNLIHGVNGSGKTSLLEAIELWMCGKHYRNPEDLVNPNSVAIMTTGDSEMHLGPELDLSFYRNRDHVWYGNYQARKNELCFNFARFNFYNSDAGVRLELSQDEPGIQEALSKLLLGESATRLAERIARILPELQKKERELTASIKRAKEAILSARKTIKSLKKPTSTRKQAYDHLIKQIEMLGWKKERPNDSQEKLLMFLDSLNRIATNIAAVIDAVSWRPNLSASILNKEKRSLEQCCIKLSGFKQDEQKFDLEHIKLVSRIKEFERQRKLIERRISYIESGADMLRNAEQSIMSLHQKKRRLIEGQQQIANINLSKYSKIKETISTMEMRIKKKLTDKRNVLADQNHDVKKMEKVYGEIASLVTEIRSKAQSFLQIDLEAQICPVCGAVYSKGELFQRVQKEYKHKEHPDLINAQSLLMATEKEVQQLTRMQNEFEIMKLLGEEFFGLKSSESVAVDKLVDYLSSMDKNIAKCESDIAKVKQMQMQLEAKGFDERELTSLERTISEEFANVDTSNKLALKKLLKQLRSDKVQDRSRQVELEEEIAIRQRRISKLLLKHLRSADVTYDEAQTRLYRVKECIDRLSNIEDTISFFKNQLLDDLLVQTKSLRESVEGYLRIIQKEDSVKAVINYNLIDLKQGRELLDREKPKRERLISAITVLENIQKKHGANRYMKDFFSQNIEQVSELFRLIHAPKEFERIIWEEKGTSSVTAIRQSGPASPISKLSSGQRNALSLSLFLTMNRKVNKGPAIIILDDPVSHVDDLNIVSFFDCLRLLILGSDRQLFFTTASTKTANLFRRKFDFLGSSEYLEIELTL